MEFQEEGMQSCVYKEEWSGYACGWTEAIEKHHSVATVADSPFIRLSADANDTKAPLVKISHSCFAKVKTPEVVREQKKNVASKLRASIFGIYVPYPYRYIHRTHAIRVDSYHSAAMDATLDDNNESIVLLPPNDLRRAAFLNSGLELDYIAKTKKELKLWALASAVCAAASAMLFGGAFNS